MDLGRKLKSPGEVPASPVNDKEPKISFPGFTLSDEIADKFLKDYDCDLGDEITATVKLKVTSLRKDEYGNSVGFDVTSLDNVEVTGEEDESDEEEKVLGYKRKKSEASVPDTSEAEVED